MMKKGAKRFFSILLAAVLAVPAAIPAGTTAQAAETEKKIKILATSDQHGKFLAYDYTLDAESAGSMAQIATVVKERRTDSTILIDVGDTIESNSANIFLKDDVHPMIAGFNQIGYDFWVAGNHEFNYGVETLQKVAGQFKGKFLCGNVYDKAGKTLGASYELVDKGGVKVAVIGFVTPNIVQWDGPRLTDYKVANPLADGEMKAAIDRAKSEKADVIVAALHMDLESEGAKGSGVYDYAEAFPEINVILGAHGHTMQNTEKNGVKIIENKYQGGTIADIDITVKQNSSGGYEVTDVKPEMVSITKDTASDAQFVEALKSYDERAKADAQTVIGKLEGGNLIPETEIPGITQGLIQETALVSLINKVLLHYTGADISAASLLDANTNVSAGDIKKCDTAKIYKYGNNTLYLLELNGKQLKQYMEWTAGYFNTYKEGDLTVSFDGERRSYLYDMLAGLTYKIDISKEIGSRITDLKKADGTPVQDTDTFKLAINNYNAGAVLLKPGNAFKEGDELPKLIERDFNAGESVRDMIGRYITDVAKGLIKPDLYGNWEITGTDWNPDLHAKAAELVKAGTIKIGSSDGRTTENVKSITVDDLKAAGVSVVSAKLDANGGTAGAGTCYALKGGTYGKLPEAARDGYKFDGWYTAKSGGTKVTESTKAAEGTLYAVWTSEAAPAVKAPGKAAIKKVQAGKKSATVTYGKVAGATGYRVEYAASKTFKGAKSVYTAKTSAKITKLASGKKYYVRVSAYTKGADGKKVYGKASAVKSVTAK